MSLATYCRAGVCAVPRAPKDTHYVLAGKVASTSYVERSVGPAANVPPRESTRSDMPAVPVPAETGAVVGVCVGRGLVTVTWRRFADTETVTVTGWPGACFAAFVRHSWTTR